jgi:hypothetical protein
VGHARASIDVPGRPSDAEELWYDLSRWPGFVDGLAAVARVSGEWPRAGAEVVWDSRPGGRGRVLERVLLHEARRGQRVEVEDERLRGTQSIAFQALEDGVELTLALEYELKERTLLSPIVDALFIRRALRDSLRRTLARFLVELEGDLELGAPRSEADDR